MTECLLLLHGGDAECESSMKLYNGQILKKIADFVNHDKVSHVQRVNMIKGFFKEN